MPNDWIEENEEEDEALGEKHDSLMIACIDGDIDCVIDSLNLGADINKPGSNLLRPLENAIENYHVEVVSMLLDVPELEINVKNKFGFTALMLASSMGNTEIVKLLLAQPRIEINTDTGPYGLNLVTLSIFHGHEEIAQLLLKQTDLELKYNEEMSLASLHGQVDVVRDLIRFGCDVDRKIASHTVIYITMAHCDRPDSVLKIIDILLAAGCIPSTEDVQLAIEKVPRLEGILCHESQVPLKLQTMCRKVIWTQLRRCSNGKNIQHLVAQFTNDIPETLVDYLRFVSTSKYFD